MLPLLLLLLFYIAPIINKFFEDFTDDKNKINRALDFRNRHPPNIFKHRDHKLSNKLENNIPSNTYWKDQSTNICWLDSTRLSPSCETKGILIEIV